MQYLGVFLLLAAFGLWMVTLSRHPRAPLPAKGSYGRAAYAISPSTAAILAALCGLFLITESFNSGY